MIQLQESHDEIASTERAFVRKTIEVCQTYLKPLEELSDLIGDLDICLGFASILSLMPNGSEWTRPEILTGDEGPVIEFVNGRHPILELLAERRGGVEAVVPNNLHLSGSQDRILLVSGPNMGGKSTFARQQALLCLLAQVGCPVPAAKAALTPVINIWPRIGAQDNPSKGVSTFMTEAVETAVMLAVLAADARLLSRNTRPVSLLVIDELGRGTSSIDGLAFAYGVLKHLSAMNNVCAIFATHFHELGLAKLPGVRAVCMAKSAGRPSFRIQDGVEEDSDGILLAQKFGFPAKVVEEALLRLQNSKSLAS